MLKAVSTYVYVKERLHPGLLDELVKSGAQSIEIFAARQHFDYGNRKQHVREIADWFHSSGVPLNSIHAPLYSDYDWGRAGSPPVNIASTDRARPHRCHGRDQARAGSRRADSLSFPGAAHRQSQRGVRRKKFENAMTSVEHLRAFAKPLGVRPAGGKYSQPAFTPERLVEFIQTMHFDDIGVCFDCGHAHMMGGIPEAFGILKDHICSTHVHDNNKDKDSHLWPGNGSIDWKETMELLRTAPQNPPLLLEIDGEEKKNPGEEVMATFHKLEG